MGNAHPGITRPSLRVTCYLFFFSSRRRHTRFDCDWSSDVCSSDLFAQGISLSKDWFDDQMHGVWSNDVKEMSRKALVTQDFHAMGLWRNSFTTQLTEIGRASCRERV